MELPSTIKFADEKIRDSFEQLEKEDPLLYKTLSHAFLSIQRNAFCSIQIPKNLIPKEYTQKYGVTNLWKYDLPKGWRLLYSIAREEVIVVSIILEWMTHKEYEWRFHYK